MVRARPRPRRAGRGGAAAARRGAPSRAEVVERLDREGLLPAITFIFSRAGCDAAVQQCLRAGLRLTTPEERAEIRAHRRGAQRRHPRRGPRACSATRSGSTASSAGIAAHHAGHAARPSRRSSRSCSSRGLVKAVFATETLALGINMPARSVVLEKLVKWNGETHADVTPGEYTQLTGRAGRRGIDVEGHAVVLWQPGPRPGGRWPASPRPAPTRCARASARRTTWRSTWSARSAGARARELLESSFAQFQADRAVVGLARQVRRNEEALDGLRARR